MINFVIPETFLEHSVLFHASFVYKNTFLLYLRGFANRVLAMNKQLVLQGGDGHTFFLPVDGNNNLETWDRVDDKASV